jgi:hypothetical protein
MPELGLEAGPELAGPGLRVTFVRAGQEFDDAGDSRETTVLKLAYGHVAIGAA